MTSFVLPRPASTEYAEYYHKYVSVVPDGDVIELLQQHGAETVTLLRGVSEEKSAFAYAPGKWTIREVMGHVMDAERVFTYRALHFARGDKTPLPSFEENAWAKVSGAASRRLEDLTDEYIAVRACTLALFRGFTRADFERTGIASDNRFTVSALAYITAGHERHHVRILRERYGI